MSGFHVRGEQDNRNNRELQLQTADIGRSRPPRWAWQHRVVIGRLNLLLGNEGIGKGALIAWLIARLTRGELDGDLKGTPVNIGIVGDEDDLDSVWTPRLHAAGAELGRVCQIERPDGGLVNVGEDRARLARLVRDTGIKVLYFDQLLDNLGGGVDDWRQKTVRDAIAPLRTLARDLEIAALGTLHPNKKGRTFRELSSGTPAFNAASRSSLLLAAHPEDENLRVLVRGKGNLSMRPTPLEFELASHSFEANGHDFSVPVARGFRPSEFDVDALIDREQGHVVEHGQAADAREIIETLLPHDGKWHSPTPIYQACEGEQISAATVKRAKQQLGIEHRRTATFPASIIWRWPTVESPVSTHENDEPCEPSGLSATGRFRAGGGRGLTQITRLNENMRADRRADSEPAGKASSNGAASEAKATIEAELRHELEGELP
jgi:hypothetical protein